MNEPIVIAVYRSAVRTKTTLPQLPRFTKEEILYYIYYYNTIIVNLLILLLLLLLSGGLHLQAHTATYSHCKLLTIASSSRFAEFSDCF